MADKIKIAINWASACGGCDVSLLDIEEKIFDIVSIADIVFWPVAMDFKRKDLMDAPNKSIDIGLFNGAIRSTEQAEDAEILREKCKVLIAYGSCACFGGIPGLANVSNKEEIFQEVYQKTPSTVNPDNVYPQEECTVNDMKLELPGLFDTVQSLHQRVDVDYYLPGCPPPTERILDAVQVIAAYAQQGDLPPKGAVIASEKAMCDTCKRIKTRTPERISTIYRPHEIIADENICFLEQGILCMGPFTRDGCTHSCINANMPCRGCFGPLSTLYDPGAEALSTFGSIVGEAQEDFQTRAQIVKSVNTIKDPLGTIYRFTFPCALVNRTLKDEKNDMGA
ncbi:NADH ubiquinone oxidoreductase 20 kDa subunit [Candidatus Magnetomorum sp. HK-1]|nr:NADH ubiquinone oxidoreductase 20 kDa subunit [Candidatus Magnetomorum sp. HK-1]